MTLTVFRYLILISIDFLTPLFLLFPLILALTEKIYQTRKTVRYLLDYILNTSNVTNISQCVVISTLFTVFGNVFKQDAKSRPNSV